jgi:hypothetical protein
MTARTVWSVCLLAVVTACADIEQAAPPGSIEGARTEEDGDSTRRVYERNLVFASLEGDSLFIVPWMMRTAAGSDWVVRSAWAWLARGGVWAPFYAEHWRTPPTREPSRILPHEGMRLLVRDGDGIDGLIFEEGQRALEIILGDVVASWTGPKGGSYEVLTGSAYLVDQRVDGVVLHMARASVGARPPGGDWAFLLSGDSARFVLVADAEYGGEVAPLYRGWGEHGGVEMQWAEVRVDWRRTEAFPPARRDVPVAWRVWSSDEMVEGELEAVSAELQPGTGPGPLLPVRGLFEVVGELSTVEGTFPVRGIVVHERR